MMRPSDCDSGAFNSLIHSFTPACPPRSLQIKLQIAAAAAAARANISSGCAGDDWRRSHARCTLS